VLLRERGRRGFTAQEARTVAGISGRLASVLRRGQLTAAQPLRAPGEAIGLLILDERNRIRTVNAQARAWLAQLEDAEAPQLAHVVYGVANRARNADDGMASTRARTSVGGWLVLTATVLDPTVDDGVAVVLRPATRPELVPLLLHAFGLTPREQQVMQLMARGRSTQQAARLLGLSPYTVTDHLRSIYAKTGVTSRQELQVLLLADR
jgi:DNA-binding CsgD family transcriptional regulator